MNLGFETIGNAALIFHDGSPVLTTDPWLDGRAYFGSWDLSHQIPAEQRAHVEACPYLWISHGHPDHLSPESLEKLRGKTILLPDHVGGRIANDLRTLGHEVRVLRCGEWTQLSERCRVISIADVMQDAILIVELGNALIIDANDCSDHGQGAFVHQLVSQYENTFLACLTGYGDADMINFFDESGKRILPAAAKKEPFGTGIAGLLQTLGIKYFAPSSSMHKYRRTDSAWANEYITPKDVHHEGFWLEPERLLPSFVRFDLERMEPTPIDPPAMSDDCDAPEVFGDSWSDELELGDVEAIRAYLEPVQHLKHSLGFIAFEVGGKTHRFDINPREHQRGVTFAVPRNSLMTAVQYKVFDDLLIGNFMRTTLHGDWWGKQGTAALYPHFAPFLTKFGDNGGACTESELRAYFKTYLDRGFFRYDPDSDPEERHAIGRYV